MASLIQYHFEVPNKTFLGLIQPRELQIMGSSGILEMDVGSYRGIA